MSSTRAFWLAPLLVLPLVLAGCSGSSDDAAPSTGGTGAPAAAGSRPSAASPGSAASAGSPGSPGSTASSEATTQPTTAGTTQPASGGCAARKGAIPKGAAEASSPDLDRDGKRDTLWLADSGTTRTVGVRTAQGAVFATPFTSAAPQAATAIGQRLGDGSGIILLNTGRSVALYSVVNCQIVPAQNLQGQQYTFDLGFTGYGTGVRCVDSGRGLQVAGMLAEQKAAGRYAVYQTRVALSENNTQARNAPRQTIAAAVAAGSALVRSARTVTCGPKNPGVSEPQS
jgi:hypothetical protein